MRSHRAIPCVAAILSVGCSQILGFDDLSFDPKTGSKDASVDTMIPDAPADRTELDVKLDTGTDGSADASKDGPTDSPSDVVADSGPEGCTGKGPAFVHGDLWGFWSNVRAACNPQHRWLWICEKRFGAGNCPEEKKRFDECWAATGGFSPPAPHAANINVCRPQDYPDKNLPAQRPNNEVPCDTTTFKYDALRTTDPFFGPEWFANQAATHHLTLKVFEASADPYAEEGAVDGLVAWSTHGFALEAYMKGGNHTYAEATTRGACLPPLNGSMESPYPSQNFGAFFWLEVPTNRAVTLSATWIGRFDNHIPEYCRPETVKTSLYGFPESFSAHSVDGKPWLISSPCGDLQKNVTLLPGRHYIWDLEGFRILPDCKGPPEALLAVVPEDQRARLQSGDCSKK